MLNEEASTLALALEVPLAVPAPLRTIRCRSLVVLRAFNDETSGRGCTSDDLVSVLMPIRVDELVELVLTVIAMSASACACGMGSADRLKRGASAGPFLVTPDAFLGSAALLETVMRAAEAALSAKSACAAVSAVAALEPTERSGCAFVDFDLDGLIVDWRSFRWPSRRLL